MNDNLSFSLLLAMEEFNMVGFSQGMLALLIQMAPRSYKHYLFSTNKTSLLGFSLAWVLLSSLK